MLTTRRRLRSIIVSPGVEITHAHTPGDVEFFRRSEQRIGPDLVQVELRDIVEEVVLDHWQRMDREHLHLGWKIRFMTFQFVKMRRLFHAFPLSCGQISHRVDGLALLADLEMQLGPIRFRTAELGVFCPWTT